MTTMNESSSLWALPRTAEGLRLGRVDTVTTAKEISHSNVNT
jgi:hypothetical protein